MRTLKHGMTGFLTIYKRDFKLSEECQERACLECGLVFKNMEFLKAHTERKHGKR